MYKLLTGCGTLGLVTVIKTVVKAVTAIRKGHASAVVTGEGQPATLLHGRLLGRALHTRHMVGSQPHPTGAATHPLGIRHWEAEVTAVAVWVGGSVTGIRP